MHSLVPHFEITRDDVRRELHWTATGLWTLEKAQELPKALYKQSLPFIETKRAFRVFGDLTEFAVQSQDVVDVMQVSQENSAQLGVDRMAILYASILVKIQFRRISDALELKFFEDRDEALAWLRE